MRLIDRAMSGRLAKTEQPDDPEYVYSPYISVLREWFNHARQHLCGGNAVHPDASAAHAGALFDVLRQACTRPRSAAGGIEDLIGEILRGGRVTMVAPALTFFRKLQSGGNSTMTRTANPTQD
jgi:hypothetical protein